MGSGWTRLPRSPCWMGLPTSTRRSSWTPSWLSLWQEYAPTMLRFPPQHLGSSTSFLLFIVPAFLCKFSSWWRGMIRHFCRYALHFCLFCTSTDVQNSSLKTCFRLLMLSQTKHGSALQSTRTCRLKFCHMFHLLTV